MKINSEYRYLRFTILGKPNPVKFNSETRGHWRDSYNISWAVESLSPIEEYKLLFRRLPDTGSSEDGHPQPLHHQSQSQSQRKYPGKVYHHTIIIIT